MKKSYIILFISILLLYSASTISASAKQYLPLKEKTAYYVPDVSDFTFLDLEKKGEKNLYAYIYGPTSYVNVYNETGGLMWNTWLRGMSQTACTGGVTETINLIYVDDLNSNKDLDILASTKVRASQVTLDPFSYIERELDWVFLNHKLKERWEKRDFDGIATEIGAYDLNSDGTKEIIVSSASGLIYVFDLYGSLIKTYSLNGMIYAIDAYDLDNNGKGEIAAGTYQGVYLLEEGRIKWTYQTEKRMSDIAMGTLLFGESRMNAVIASDAENLYYFTAEGKLDWKISAPNGIELLIGDIDNDSSTEIITASKNKIIAYQPNGSVKWEYVASDDIISMRLVSENEIGIVVRNHVYLLETDNNYMKNQMAYALLKKAKEYYMNDNCVGAKTPAEGALDIFKEINNTDGSLECDVIVKQCERDEASKGLADEYYAMALKYFADKDFESSRDYAEKSRDIYLEIGYTYGVTWLCDILIDNITAQTYEIKVKEGDNYYSDAYWAYTNNDLRTANENLEKARKTYLEVNYSRGLETVKDLRGMMEIKEKKKTADELMQRAQEVYDAGNYSDALPLAQQATELYAELNLSDEATSSGTLKNSIEEYIKAGEYFTTAQKHYSDGNYENASYFASESKRIYEDLEDYGRYGEIESFMAETKKRMDENKMIELLKIAGLIALALTVTAVIFSILKSRKKQNA